MASQTKWGFQFKENKLYILLNRAPMRKPNGEEYSSVTYIERGNSAIQVKFHFENSKTARCLFRTDFDGDLDDFNKKFSVAATTSNTAFINCIQKETGVQSRKRGLLENRTSTSGKRPKLATDSQSQDMPGSQRQSLLVSPEFGEKFLGQFDVKLTILEPAPSSLSVRNVNDVWVKNLKTRILKDPGKAPVILPALIDSSDCPGKDNFQAQDLSTYTVYALGGNHLLAALKEILADHPEFSSCMSNIRVDLYAGLTEPEARAIANRHNAKMKCLEITFQDKVRQARWLKESGTQHLTTDTAKLLSDMTLQDVPKESVTTVVSVANYSDQSYLLVTKIFQEYEDKYGPGKSVPVKLFKTLQGSAFTPQQKESYLRLALDSSLVHAGIEAEKEKKVKIVQQTFVTETTCTNWEEAKELYPQHTSDEVISKLADFKVQRETIPKKLLNHIQSAKADLPLMKEPDIELKVLCGGIAMNTRDFPEIERILNTTKTKIARALSKSKQTPED